MDGIIFDVDGTLWDSTKTVVKSWNQAIRENSDLDMVITDEFLFSLFGKTMDVICAELFPDFDEAERARLGELCFAYENRLLETEPGTLYEGVLHTFARLSEKYPLYIVSNCQCGYIEVMLKTTGLGQYVKDTLCFGQTQTSKGKTIRTLMERNHLQDVVYVGDTQGDADACKEADVPFIFADYGFGKVPGAKRTIHSIGELTEMFL